MHKSLLEFICIRSIIRELKVFYNKFSKIIDSNDHDDEVLKSIKELFIDKIFFAHYEITVIKGVAKKLLQKLLKNDYRE